MLHLHLDRPSASPRSLNKAQNVLIWGASSSFGAFSVQLASQAGYTVIGVASAHNEQLVRSLGATHFVDRKSSSVKDDLISLGPYKAVLAAQDSAEDQPVIGEVLAAGGGGRFLSTMGVRKGVKLPDGVAGFFAQFLDDYLDSKNEKFTRWVWWEYLEDALVNGTIKTLPVDVLGGLSKVQQAWDILKEGSASGRRLVIRPDLD